MIWVIARREFGAMFLAPLAWVILAVIQIILGYMFLTTLDNFLLLQPQLLQLQNTPGVTDIVIAPLMQVAAIILLMIMPLLTMRSIAEEKRNRSLTLLISSQLLMSSTYIRPFTLLALTTPSTPLTSTSPSITVPTSMTASAGTTTSN